VPTLHSHTITHGLFVFNGVREPQGGLPSRTSQHAAQNLAAACVCPTAQPTDHQDEKQKGS